MQIADEWMDTMREGRLVGPRRLLAEILVQAMNDAVGNMWDYKNHKKRHLIGGIVEEAKGWFNSDSMEEWSFLWVCEHLNLDPTYILTHLFSKTSYSTNIGRGEKGLGLC